MVTLTAFADEISEDLTEQLDVLESEGIRHLEFRGVWSKNVLDLTDHEVEEVANTLKQRGFRVSAIGSPIGKISITDDFGLHVKRFRRAIDVAKRFDTKYIRIFSFFIPEGDDPSVHRDEVVRRMRSLVEIAEEADVILLHENEKEIYGDTSERCLDLLMTCESKQLKCAFDPANFVQCGVKPYVDAYPKLEPYVEYVHIKDALFAGGKVVPAGRGDGDVKTILRALFERGYGGFLSIEPHLKDAGTHRGFSGPQLFGVASAALKELLKQLDEQWQ